jgi:hypothetical protein
VLANVDTAPISEKLRATLHLLRKVSRETTVTPDDMRAVLATGATKQQILDALAVSFAFNVLTRLADTFEFEVGSRSHFEAAAKTLLSRGYK